MKQIYLNLVKFIQIVRGFFPAKLPLNLADFEIYASSIFELYDVPDMPSYRHAIASGIMRLGPITAYKSKFYFALSVKKAMANEIAFQNIQLLKKQEQEYNEKAEANLKGISVVQNKAV